jgi:hypothetical protein
MKVEIILPVYNELFQQETYLVIHKTYDANDPEREPSPKLAEVNEHLKHVKFPPEWGI